jgi:hypothetical protein
LALPPPITVKASISANNCGSPYQNALAHFKGKDEAIPMKLRVTEVFRLERDAWKLVHRHADPLAEAKDAKKH